MSGDREDQQPGAPGPEERRDEAGNRTMQLDAVSEDMFEDLDYPDREEADPDVAPPPAAAPPPLPKKRGKRWSPTAIAALLGVVVMAALLGLLAANFLFGDDEPADASATEPADPGAEAEAEAAAVDEEEGEPEFVPLELDEVVIESGSGDEGGGE